MGIRCRPVRVRRLEDLRVFSMFTREQLVKNIGGTFVVGAGLFKAIGICTVSRMGRFVVSRRVSGAGSISILGRMNDR